MEFAHHAGEGGAFAQAEAEGHELRALAGEHDIVVVAEDDGAGAALAVGERGDKGDGLVDLCVSGLQIGARLIGGHDGSLDR